MQPSLDLMNRIAHRDFKRIMDVGCGTGLSTLPLVQRWQEADIVGVDLSENMLQKATELCPSVTWLQRDCSKPLLDLGQFDLVFSNAFLQWLPDQEAFLKNTAELLTEEGVLAVQLPAFLGMPVECCIRRVAESYGAVFEGIDRELYKNYTANRYYELVKRYFSRAEVWQTSYYHGMENHEGILEFVKGTALIPFLSRLDEEQGACFCQSVLDEIKQCYPVQEDGKVLFQFDRIFFIGYK